MNPFNAAKCLTAQDKILQKQHNYLVDLMQEQIKMLRAELANGLSIVNGVLALDLASTSQPGALSAADWNTFNNKQAALTFGIEDGNAVEIDDTDVANGMFPRFTADGLEGLTAEQVRTAIGAITNDLQARMAYALDGYPTALMGRLQSVVEGA